MYLKKVDIKNGAGIHVRPSTVILNASQEYKGVIMISAKNMDIKLNDPSAAIGLLAMGLKKGDQVQVNVSGPDEDVVGEKISGLFGKIFDFPPRK